MAEFNFVDTMIIVAMAIIYVVLTSWLTIKIRSKTSEQFMTAARALPPALVGVLMMSEFIGAKSTVGTAQEAFTSGIAASWSTVSASIGFLLFGMFFVRKLYNTGEYTISAAVEQKFGRGTMLTVSLIMIYALLLVNVGNYISGAAAVATVLKVDLRLAMVIIAVVSTIYYMYGGLKGVAWVTLLHSAVKIVGVGIILTVALTATGGFGPMVASMPAHYWTWDGSIGGSTIFAWIIGTTGSIFCTQFIVQAISGSPSANDARRATFYAAFFCMPIALALGVIGVAAKYLHPTMKSIYALPVFVQGMNPLLAGLVATGLVASAFVSVCTVALAIVSLIMRDFYIPRYKPTEEQEMRATRWISLAVALLPLVFVFFIPQILRLSFFTRALRLSIGIIAVMGFYLPAFRSGRGATTGLIASCVLTSVWYVVGNPYGIDNMYIAMVTPIVVMVLERALGWQKPHVVAPGD